MSESTILVVDNEPSIRDRVGITLDLAGFNALTAATADDAHDSIVDEKPDLVLLDWMLPSGSGIELTRRLRQDEQTAKIPIIMLAGNDSEDARMQGLSEGVDDYITKPFSPRDLVARIKTVLLRVNGKPIDEVIQVFDLQLDPVSHRISIEDKPLEMGPTEYRLLKFFMSNQEKVFSRRHIQNQVWGGKVHLEERTIDVHIRRLRKALGSVEGTSIDYSRLVQTVRSAGYRFSVRLS